MRFRHYTHVVYRNIVTADPSQELMDDLTSSPEEQERLKKYYYTGYAKREGTTPIERVLEKSMVEIIQAHIDEKFAPRSWHATRYSDGTWPVLYTAEAEETALHEALFHMMAFYHEELTRGPVYTARRVLQLRVQSARWIDCCADVTLDRAQLTSRDNTGYPYCQTLAQEARSRGAQLLRAPSARDPHGVTVPIFEQKAITKDDRYLKYLRVTLNADGTVIVTGMIEEAPRTYQVYR